MDVTKNFDANRQEAKAEINKKLDDAKKENQSIIDKQKQGLDLSKQEQDQLKAYNDKVENYQRLGVLLDSISTGLSAPTSSGLGIATATLSPAASYKIGQYFKEQASNNANGQLTSGQEAAHILAHTVLGAAVAAAGGNDALTAGLSAGGAEAAAPILSKFLYGKAAKDLTADQKSTISSIVGLAGSAVGATTGDIGSTVQSGQVAQNAVENNEMGFPAIVNSDWASGAESLTKFAKDKNLSQKETQKLLSEYTKGKVPAGYDPVKYYIYLSMGLPAVAFAPESIGIASLGGAVIGAGSDVIVQSANNNPYDWRNTAIAFGVGAITQGKGLGFNIAANVYSEGAKAYLNNESMESAGVKATATTIVSTAM
nr:VENN motif pre-toxin domain-containing protein [Acinetobacter seifertii]